MQDMQRKKLVVFYDYFIIILALFSLGIVLVDIFWGLTPWQSFVDATIYCIFFVDYFARLLFSKDRKRFVKENVFDLIAIIPLGYLFMGLKITRLSRLIELERFFKLFRLLSHTARFLKKATHFLSTNGFKYILMITFILILLGGISIHYAENMSISDGIWWAFVTATTVGYGDISPDTTAGRFIAMILMLVGIGLVGSLSSAITSYFLKGNHHKTNVHHETITNIKKRLDDIKNLSDEDIDVICNILKTLNKNKNS